METIRRCKQYFPSSHLSILSNSPILKQLYAISLIIFVFIKPHEIILFSSGPLPTEPEISSRLVSIVYTITRSLSLLTLFCQRRLNHRLRVFTGQYKISAFLSFGLSALGYVNYAERWVGRNVGMRQRVSLEDAVGWTLGFLGIWQACVFKSVKQEEAEDT